MFFHSKERKRANTAAMKPRWLRNQMSLDWCSSEPPRHRDKAMGRSQETGQPPTVPTLLLL